MSFKSLLFSWSKRWMTKKERELVKKHLFHWDSGVWSVEETSTEYQKETKLSYHARTTSKHYHRPPCTHCLAQWVGNWGSCGTGTALTIWDKFLRETMFSFLKNSINTTRKLTNVCFLFLLSKLFKPLINLQAGSSIFYDVLQGVFQI